VKYLINTFLLLKRMDNKLISLLVGTKRKSPLSSAKGEWYYDRNAWKCVTRYMFLPPLCVVRHLKARNACNIHGVGSIGDDLYVLEYDALKMKCFIVKIDPSGCFTPLVEIRACKYTAVFIITKFGDLILYDDKGVMYKYTIPLSPVDTTVNADVTTTTKAVTTTGTTVTTVTTVITPINILTASNPTFLRPVWERNVGSIRSATQAFDRTIVCAGLTHLKVIDIRGGDVVAVCQYDKIVPVSMYLDSSNTFHSIEMIDKEKYVTCRKLSYTQMYNFPKSLFDTPTYSIKCNDKITSVCEMDGVVFMCNKKHFELQYHCVDNPTEQYNTFVMLRGIQAIKQHNCDTLVLHDSRNILLMRFEK
jgi:hypothetical protein